MTLHNSMYFIETVLKQTQSDYLLIDDNKPC